MITGFGISLSLLLVLLIKVFFVVFIVGLAGGFIFIAKNYIFTSEDVEVIKGTFKVTKSKEEI